MRRLFLIVGIIALSGGLAAGVWARTTGRIVGTNRSDVLKGTAAADTLDGRAGNDKLYGLAGSDVLTGGPGNDRLVGGPGRDRLRCGQGKDTALADSADTVGTDCEVVKGLSATPPPVAPPPPPSPPPPPQQQARGGHYCGFTNQGKSICFDVSADGTSVANFDTTSNADCDNATISDVGLSFGSSTPIQPDLSFSFTYNGGLRTGSDSPLTNVTTSYTVSGKFDTAGNAAGSLGLTRFSFDYQGSHYDCGAAPYGWQARAGA
jgi:Ca2+-binding RTX toxin-like protein